MAEPENRLQAGIDLFNESEHLQSISSISKSFGQPEIHVTLLPSGTAMSRRRSSRSSGPPSPGGSTLRTGPRRRRAPCLSPSTSEDVSGLDSKPSDPRIGPGGRIFFYSPLANSAPARLWLSVVPDLHEVLEPLKRTLAVSAGKPLYTYEASSAV
jgi:hypothetical protein